VLEQAVEDGRLPDLRQFDLEDVVGVAGIDVGVGQRLAGGLAKVKGEEVVGGVAPVA
jgi:hypothetical protein